MQKGEPKGPRDEKVTKPRGKKKRTRWCGGHVGRVHVPAIVIGVNEPLYRRTCRAPTKWAQEMGYRWWCHHSERCLVCGKILRWRIKPEECPDYKVAA